MPCWEGGPPPPPPSAPAPSAAKPAVKSPQPEKKKAPPKPAQVNPLIKEYDPWSSRLSLSLGPETAQSAHSYLTQQSNESKVKVKSRPAEPVAPEKKSLFSRLRRDADEEEEEPPKKDEKKGNR